MIGDKLGDYRMVAKTGEGGMGVVYRAGRDDGLYFVMELVEGQTLSEVARTTKLRRRGKGEAFGC